MIKSLKSNVIIIRLHHLGIWSNGGGVNLVRKGFPEELNLCRISRFAYDQLISNVSLSFLFVNIQLFCRTLWFCYLPMHHLVTSLNLRWTSLAHTNFHSKLGCFYYWHFYSSSPQAWFITNHFLFLFLLSLFIFILPDNHLSPDSHHSPPRLCSSPLSRTVLAPPPSSLCTM